ncbi:ATP-binding protein [Listeria innocua]|uniref:ATP-binding protein n=1 Tax=Listeria innocua TaxID=1642 RepID=UPI001624EDBF|nr:SbcC/MukB-like Walker B domain-containing protein [Listeria innocua]MBC2140649.1 hypothetical protein [Listeria innocua]
MIKLKRLLLIHWQAYDFQLVEFEDITLITGQTGVGKSTIIDALNIVLLGEKQKHIFNKAANENSSRTLASYLYGKLGDDGDDGFFYLREENFTSYLVAEFENEETSEYFCCGFVADCSSDHSSPNMQWLTIKSAMPTDYFISQEAGIPYSIGELTYLNNLKNETEKVELIVTDKDYRKKIAGLFGQIRDDYRRLLKQSVSFTPVKDIEMFLTDFVSETESPVNVEEMQKSIRRYNDLEQESDRIKSKVTKLEVIKDDLQGLEKRKLTELRQEYFIEKAKLDELQEQEQQHHIEVEKYQQKIEKNTRNIACFSKRKDELAAKKVELQDKRDSLVVLKYLNKEINNVKEQFQIIQEQTNRGQNTIHLMKCFIKELKVLPNELDSIANLIQIFEKYDQEQELISKFVEVNDLLNQIVNELNDYKRALNEQEKGINSKLATLLNEKEKLEKGIKIVPEQFRVFRKELQRHLCNYDKNTRVEYLSDVIDFKQGEESWQTALEAYLGGQRYYLVINPKFYNKALRYYQSVQKQREVYGIGIINLEKLQKKHFNAENNSLAQKLTTSNQLVRNYINFLLGHVIACDAVFDLAQYTTSITIEGFLYKGFVTRKLRFENLTMSIGSNAIEKQLLDVRGRSKECQAELHILQKEITVLGKVKDYQKKDSYSCEIVTKYADGRELEQKSAELMNLESQLNNLDDSELVEVDKKIKCLDKEVSDLTIKITTITTDLKSSQEAIDQINKRILPQCIEEIIVKEKNFHTKFETCHQLTSFEEAYRVAVNKLDNIVYRNFITNYENNLKQTQVGISELKERIRELMNDYNQTFTENLPINLKQSNLYIEEYEKFMNSDLPKFELDIKDAKEKAIYEFRYEFLGKLKSNIENLQRQVHEINDALKNRKFGEDTYRFKITAASGYSEYHEMIMDEMLMDQGEWNLLSAAFESKYAQQIELLFSILSGNDLSEGQSKESRIQTFSDYKTYLTFDMIVKKGDSMQRLSKTYTQKSGGETQIPLYISLLAAFSQVYRVNKTRRNNTIRLIIMDEAFNKIDGEKIKQCIQMIRGFGLQAIFSTPPEKISGIMEEADKALVVFRHQNQATLREFSSLDELIGEPYEL